MADSAEKDGGHPFALVLDQSPIHGHIFGTLSVRLGTDWRPVERRCRLCNLLPIELLTVDGGAIECKGLARVLPPGSSERSED